MGGGILESLGRKWGVVGCALEHIHMVLVTFSTRTFPWEMCSQTYLCHHVLTQKSWVELQGQMS
jgi:hypothetical protein